MYRRKLIPEVFESKTTIKRLKATILILARPLARRLHVTVMYFIFVTDTEQCPIYHVNDINFRNFLNNQNSIETRPGTIRII